MLATFEEFDLTFRIINDLFVKKALIGDPSSVGEEENNNDLWSGFYYTIKNMFMRMKMEVPRLNEVTELDSDTNRYLFFK